MPLGEKFLWVNATQGISLDTATLLTALTGSGSQKDARTTPCMRRKAPRSPKLSSRGRELGRAARSLDLAMWRVVLASRTRVAKATTRSRDRARLSARCGYFGRAPPASFGSDQGNAQSAQGRCAR